VSPRSGGPLGLFAHHREHEPQHLVILMVLAGTISFTATIVAASIAGFGAVANAARHVNFYWVPFAMVGAAAAQLGYVFAYREIAHVDRGARIGALRAGAVVAAGFGMFFPRGGFAVDLEALEDLGVPRAEARIRVLGLGSLEYAVLAAGACTCAVLMLFGHDDTARAVTLSWVIGVPVGTCLAILAVAHRDWLCRGPGRIVRPFLDALYIVGLIVAAPRRHGVKALTGMALYWAGEIFVLWVCLAAFTRHLPSIPAVVVGYATGYALTRRTLPLAGAGAVELLLPIALYWVGFPLAAAVLAVFAYRVFNLWVPIVPAAAGVIALRRRPVEGG
jgi:hypothetical protein